MFEKFLNSKKVEMKIVDDEKSKDDGVKIEMKDIRVDYSPSIDALERLARTYFYLKMADRVVGKILR